MKNLFQIIAIIIIATSVKTFAQPKPIPGGGSIPPTGTIVGEHGVTRYHWHSNGPYLQFPKKKIRTASPTIGTSIDGHSSLGIRSDNSCAISNTSTRNIVNLTIPYVEFNDENNSSSTVTDYFSWISNPTLFPTTGLFFDPRVIYDPEKDKFISAVLYDSATSYSKFAIMVSNDGNPNNGWNAFSISAPNGYWYDYTQIGMSSKDVYLTFTKYLTGTNTPAGSDIYQIPKYDLYNLTAFAPLHFTKFSSIKDKQNKPYPICPSTNGAPTFNGTAIGYGPGLFLISYGKDAANTNSILTLYDVIADYDSLTPATLNFYSDTFNTSKTKHSVQ
jgi:hypothetical protein